MNGDERVEKEREDPVQIYEYNKLEQSSINSVLAIKINVVLEINISSSSSAVRREDKL